MSKETKKQLKRDMVIDDFVRELEKADNILELHQRHLKGLAESNAALHGDDEVIYSSLYNRTVIQRVDMKRILRKYKRKVVKKDGDEAAKEK